MREIKFRARNAGVPRCWVYGYFVIEKDCCYIVNDDGRFKVIAGTQGQYTGRHNKNGKEIYEGDVISIFTKRGKKGILIEMPGCYDIEEFRLLADISKIIGNITENPELMED